MVFGMNEKYRMHLPTVLHESAATPVATVEDYMRQYFRENGYLYRGAVPGGYVMSALSAYFGDDYKAADAALFAGGLVMRDADSFILSAQERLRLLTDEGLIERWMAGDGRVFCPTDPRGGVMAQLRAELAEIGGAS